MKTRNGFVSNSSSSSFIVLLHHKPTSMEDLKDMIFKDWSWQDEISGELKDVAPNLTVRQVVERVYTDIFNPQGRSQERYNCNKENVFGGYIQEIDDGSIISLIRQRGDEISNEYYQIYHMLGNKYGYEENDIDKWKNDNLYAELLKKDKESKDYEEYYIKERNDAVSEWYQKFRDHYKYHKFEFIFEYGDRYNEYVFETGNIFRNVPHVIISNH